MLETKHHWLPVIISIYMPLSFFITYGMAVYNQDVMAIFPYISETGNHPPASCVFAQLLNMGAILAGLTMYIRYRQIALQCSKLPHRRCFRCLNIAAYIAGLLGAVGLTLVANFQLLNVVSVHLLGAFLAIGVGFVYCILQTVITFVFARVLDIPGNSICVRWFRVLLCLVNFVVLIVHLTVYIELTITYGDTSMAELSSLGSTYQTKYLVSTISQWTAAVVSVIYFATFYTEFKYFRVRPPKLEYYETI